VNGQRRGVSVGLSRTPGLRGAYEGLPGPRRVPENATRSVLGVANYYLPVNYGDLYAVAIPHASPSFAEFGAL
jgi:hypothetical protein